MVCCTSVIVASIVCIHSHVQDWTAEYHDDIILYTFSASGFCRPLIYFKMGCNCLRDGNFCGTLCHTNLPAACTMNDLCNNQQRKQPALPRWAANIPGTLQPLPVAYHESSATEDALALPLLWHGSVPRFRAIASSKRPTTLILEHVSDIQIDYSDQVVHYIYIYVRPHMPWHPALSMLESHK